MTIRAARGGHLSELPEAFLIQAPGQPSSQTSATSRPSEGRTRGLPCESWGPAA